MRGDLRAHYAGGGRWIRRRRIRLQTLEDRRSDGWMASNRMFRKKLSHHVPTKLCRVRRRQHCGVSGSGASTEDKLVKDGVRGKKPIGTIPRTSHVMPEDENTTCSCVSNYQRNQPTKNRHLRSRELNYPP